MVVCKVKICVQQIRLNLGLRFRFELSVLVILR